MAPSVVAEPASDVQETSGFVDERPRILVPEKVSPDGLAMLQGRYIVDSRTDLTADELISIIPSYHGLIVRSETKVTAPVLAAGRKLRVVARAGVGVDNIDVNAATAHGIIGTYNVFSPSSLVLLDLHHVRLDGPVVP